ncbi:L-threonylcarbamoyladenylate synthase [Aquirhabdus parva]|uniref:Threonylcarbamoyl-AMP synthase n=1 Tax=Aquirhabdus parva TaxID=2283318 RepID=A0A345P824_9GAMM|nr:Sua5/YciO/YrdC/YwlC family protein [Aquirhabdus parva]AXI03433.1 tRNA threonylcarbamoyladenosine biosynthesis protein RimN [Aquirhabdus parva]
MTNHSAITSVSAIASAVSALEQGEVIAYPTESVWGLGCDPWNEAAVQALLKLKDRPVSKGLILVAADEAQVNPFLEKLTGEQRKVVIESWLDPTSRATTWLVPLTDDVPIWISGAHDRVAVRVTRHVQTRDLCRAFGRPIVSTSANPSGEPSALDSAMVEQYFNQLVFILDGQTDGATQPSLIRDAITGEVLRA